MASKDIAYCERECEHMDCKHNKKHLKNLIISDGKRVISAIYWSRHLECEKGE